MKKFTLPQPSEKEIQKTILAYLRLKGFVCKRNNSGFVFIKGEAGKQRGINIGEAGWPDIEGMTKDGHWFGIEVKTLKGKMSPHQLDMQERITKSKGIYILARSLEDVMSAGF